MSFLAPEEKLWQTLESIARDEGLSLYDVEQHGRNVLRVFVDRLALVSGGSEVSGSSGVSEVSESSQPSADPPVKGVTSGDCSRLVRRLMVYFQAQGPSFGLVTEPEIEVSSPGVNRNLRLGVHYERAIGERVKVLSNDGPNVLGVMQSANERSIVVADEISKELRELALAEIRRANVEFKF